MRTFEIPLSVAPMMQRTDRHYRYMMRLITRRTLLWTEMVTARALLHGDAASLLRFDRSEHPLVLQLGGDDPGRMAEAAQIGEGAGYDEININVGCPSDRVKSGCFGAALMRRPERVAALVGAMAAGVRIPITVKHRIGVDELDRYDDMLRFVDAVAEAGACARFSVHARKAWLSGLSPKENRTVPPLRYDDVYRLKRERPELIVEINGGVRTMDEVEAHLERVDAVMIGRAAYDDPYQFAEADGRFFGDDRRPPTRREVALAMADYARRVLASDEGAKLHHITRHMLALWRGAPGAGRWRRVIGAGQSRPGQGPGLIHAALEALGAEAA